MEFPSPEVLIVLENSSTVKPVYLWLGAYASENCLVNRIQVPNAYLRTTEDSTSFATWLRHIPLKPGWPNVYLYDGTLKGNQQVHEAVIQIDVGKNDLQQCADVIMRLRAEYLLSVDSIDRISFNFTSGQACTYRKWSEGYRPIIDGNDVQFVKKESPDSSYAEFNNYMNIIFNYCGTYSLSQELKSRQVEDLQIGDVFIYGGFPGHAVIVMDLAVHKETGKSIFLLAQGYMPAQDLHLLKNFNNDALSPWFSASFVNQLNTPEWVFQRKELKQF
jgi:hypothetical protein